MLPKAVTSRIVRGTPHWNGARGPKVKGEDLLLAFDPSLCDHGGTSQAAIFRHSWAQWRHACAHRLQCSAECFSHFGCTEFTRAGKGPADLGRELRATAH